jgi:integrase
MTAIQAVLAQPIPADALILAGRELRDDVNLSDTCRFGAEAWELGPASHQAHYRGVGLDFTKLPERFRLTAKELFYALLSADPPAGESQLAISSVRRLFGPVKKFLDWADQHEFRTLVSITHRDLTSYQRWLLTTALTREQRVVHRRTARLFWVYRDNLSSDRLTFDPRRLPAWSTDNVSAIRGENKTDRIPEQVISPLLVWSLRWVNDFSSDIIAARTEWWQLHQRGWKLKSRAIPEQIQPAAPGTGKQPIEDLTELLDQYRTAGRPMPGNGDGSVNQTFLARQLGRQIGILRQPPLQAIISEASAELGVADATYVFTPVRACLDGEPWWPGFKFTNISELARMLQAACYIVIAYLSGMRDGEIKHLQRGCISHKRDSEGNTYRRTITSRAFKGESTPAGVTATWVISESVERAVAVLEQLQPADENYLFNVLRGSYAYRGTARAATTSSTNWALNRFIDGINTYCVNRNRSDAIPLVRGQRWVLCSSQFRRTLAWFIARRPGGAIAGTIQYRHHSIQMFEGYAGTSDSGFRAEVEAEQTLERGEQLFAMIEAHEHHDLSGPAADQAHSRLTNLERKTAYAGSVVTDPKRLAKIMRRDDPKIYLGRFVTCVYDPNKALCRRQHTLGGDGLKPDLGSCQPLWCRNVALTAANRRALTEQLQKLDEHLGAADLLAPYVAYRLTEQRRDLAVLLERSDNHAENT